MPGVRRAFLLNAGERYAVIVIQFLMTAAVSRLLTPEEIGVSVVGTGIVLIAQSLREFATSEFLIQRKVVSRTDVRTAFTILLLLNVAIAAGLVGLAPFVSRLYGEEKLTAFLHVAIIACLIDPFALPITGLLRREMAFGKLALVNTATAVVSAMAAVGLAALGFSYMSFAWALLASSATTTSLSICFRPHPWMFRPALGAWRSLITFGGYNGATTVLTRIYDVLPQLVLGRILPLSAVGLYSRANMVCSIPDRFVLSAVFSVAYPAFAAEVRKGGALKQPYLRGLSLITALHWPGLVLLALLAHPVVLLVLGDQWLEVVPLVRVIAVACLFWFPVLMTYPVLVSVGAIRDNLVSKAVSVSVAGAVLCFAAYFGIMAMAASQLVAQPFQMLVALHFVRRHVSFRWRDVPAATAGSAVVTLCSAAGPAALIAAAGFRFDLSIGAAAAAGGLAAIGWAMGLWFVRHPLLAEIATAADAFLRTAAGRRLAGMRLRPAKVEEAP